jgi:DNA-binding response OmpR family regulator
LTIEAASGKLTHQYVWLSLMHNKTDLIFGFTCEKSVTHKQLLATVWGPAHEADSHYLRIAIGHIRDKLGDDAGNPRFILTEPGVGYRLVVAEKPEI